MAKTENPNAPLDKQSEFVSFPTIYIPFHCNTFYKTKTVATCSNRLLILKCNP